jgi:uncharacterized protein (TIGR00725 family)
MHEPGRRRCVAVLGFGSHCQDAAILATAREVGEGLARRGAITCVGGYGGVFDAALQGASAAGGLCLSLVGAAPTASVDNDHVIVVRVGSDLMKRSILVETCDGAIMVGGWTGTFVLASLFLAAGKPVVVIRGTGGTADALDAGTPLAPGVRCLVTSPTPGDAVAALFQALGDHAGQVPSE